MTESSAMPTNYITFPKCIHEGPCLSCITSTMLGLHTTIEPLKDQFSTHEQIPEHIPKTCMERLFKYCLHNLGKIYIQREPIFRRFIVLCES